MFKKRIKLGSSNKEKTCRNDFNMLIGMPQRNLRHFSVDKVVPAAVFCECQINQALLLYLIRIFCGHLLHSVHRTDKLRIDGKNYPYSLSKSTSFSRYGTDKTRNRTSVIRKSYFFIDITK